MDQGKKLATQWVEKESPVANTGYSSLLPTFLSESPRKFAIFGLRRTNPADLSATKP